MSHPDAEALALCALEGVADDAMRQHVEGCATCRAELDSLRRVVEAGRGPASSRLEAPPDRVWARIADELGLEVHTENPQAPDVVGADEVTTGTVAGGVPAADDTSRPAWWRRPTAWVAAAALLLGALGTVLVQRALSPSAGDVLAAAELEPLPGWQGTGRAEVREVGENRVLVVDLDTVPPEGYREVWLISTDLERLISVGVLTGVEGTFELPDGVDLGDFAVVDVSSEPLDGDPAHSGDSIARGELA